MRDGFAVLDFETTGINPRAHDRVIEVGLVLLSPQGDVQDQFGTIVNPNRDIGPTRIHHLSPQDIIGAPEFGDIAPYLLRQLKNRIFVAHNASFDMRFLLSELNRVGIDLDSDLIPSLCTMQLAASFMPKVGRSLAACCNELGMVNDDAHAALADAQATAALMINYLRLDSPYHPWEELLQQDCDFARWPDPPLKDFVVRTRANGPVQAEYGYTYRKICQMPVTEANPAEREFLALLDEVVADDVVTIDEAQRLLDSAARAYISPERLVELRQLYFIDFVRLVWADGILTADEDLALERVAQMMGISQAELDAARARPDFEVAVPGEAEGTAQLNAAGVQLSPGDLVVLTGDMDRPRSHYERVLLAQGFGVWPTVTKKVKLVIAADPMSLSGKAKRARDLGIPIVAAHDFFEN